MNNNLLKYPIRFGTLLLAGAALVACKKEAFTEKDALALEFTRQMHKRFIDSLSQLQAKKDRLGMEYYKRTLDSLDRINAGGRVYYTVIPVNASTATFANGGRSEGAEAISTATITATQYGKTVTATGSNGVYALPELRSGEVTVNINAGTAFTEVSYISNLTPDGGVTNNSVVYVGNVIPMFEAGGTNAQKMAVVKGKAWVETDLTNDREEALTQAVLSGGGATGGTHNIITTGNIDTNGAFVSKFLSENNDESWGSHYNNQVNGNVKSGRIQRIAYESATASGLLDATGNYAMLLPASTIGLPTHMQFAEFATNRTYYRTENGASKIVSERFLYGPKVIASTVPVGVPAPTVSFQAFTTAAAATAVFTPQSTTTNGDLVAPAITTGGGFYMVAPTTTVASGNAVFSTTVATAAATNATGTAILGTPPTNWTNVSVTGLTPASNGTGYTADGIGITFTRRDTAVIGTGIRVENSTGGAFLGMATGFGYVQVVDGGGNFNFNASLTVSTANTFTNVVPKVVFTETDQSSQANPNTQFTPTGVVAGAGIAFLDYNANYNNNVNGVRAVTGLGGVTAGGGVGAIQEVQITSAGAYPAPGPFVGFSFGDAANLVGFDNAAAEADNDLFRAASNNTLEFNPTYPIANEQGGATLTATTISFANGFGAGYVFVPQVALAPNKELSDALGAAETSKLAQANLFTTTVNSDPGDAANFGQIMSIGINSAATISVAAAFGATGNDFLFNVAPYSTANGKLGISVTPTRAGNTLKAVTNQSNNRVPLGGSGLTNYTLSTSGIAKANSVAVLVGGVTSNSTQSPNTTSTQQYVEGNEMLVLFSAPSNNAAAGRNFAWGVPVWDNDAAGTNTSTTLLGVRILNAGIGYEASRSYTATLVPNPFFRGNRISATSAASIAAPQWSLPSNVPANTNGVTGDLMPWFFNGMPGAVANTAANRSRTTVTAKLTFTVGTKGAGYSVAPRVVFYGGGLDLTNYSGATNATGGVIEFSTLVDNTGGVTEVAGVTTTGTGITRVSANVFQFAVNTAPASWTATTTYSIKFIDDLSLGLTNAFRNTATVNGRVNISSDGKVSSVTMDRPSGFPVVTTGQFTGAEVIAPLVFISAPTSGTTATATASVTLDPQALGTSVGYPLDAGSVHRRVTRITVTNGGSGYSRGNMWQRLNTTGNLGGSGGAGFTPDGTPTNNGQNFWLTGGDGTTQANNWNFEVFPGMTYVRDIHYGTGKELD